MVRGRACQSPFDWCAHEAEAVKAGIERPIIDALLAQTLPEGLSQPETALVRYAQELNRFNSVADATHAEALQHFGERRLVELTALVGYYTMVAMALNAREIPLPDGVVSAFDWPQASL